MKSRLAKEIEKTIRALEEFAIDWEKRFPESGGGACRIKARTLERRFAQFLETPPQRVAAREMNHTKHRMGDGRVGKRREGSGQAVNKL